MFQHRKVVLWTIGGIQCLGRCVIKNFIGQIEVLSPECNLDTVADGRGGIFSWVPSDSIKEFTLLYFNPGKIRGNHFHPEFVEYFLVVEGKLLLTTIDSSTGEKISHLIGPGFCFRTPTGVSHAIQSISESTCISLITKPWDSCENPIIHQPLV